MMVGRITRVLTVKMLLAGFGLPGWPNTLKEETKTLEMTPWSRVGALMVVVSVWLVPLGMLLVMVHVTTPFWSIAVGRLAETNLTPVGRV